jgi:hypothetical protein
MLLKNHSNQTTRFPSARAVLGAASSRRRLVQGTQPRLVRIAPCTLCRVDQRDRRGDLIVVVGLQPPRARALLSLNAAPCALLRPPSAPGCSSHSVRTASSLHPAHKAGRRIDPRQRRSARQLGSASQTATPPRLRRVVSAAPPTALLAISCGAYGPLPAPLCLLPCACSPEPAPRCLLPCACSPVLLSRCASL